MMSWKAGMRRQVVEKVADFTCSPGRPSGENDRSERNACIVPVAQAAPWPHHGRPRQPLWKNMIHRLLLVLYIAAIWAPAEANGRYPCDRGAGGVSHCRGEKFICNNGTVSRSKKVCTGGAGEGRTTRPRSQARQVNLKTAQNLTAGEQRASRP
ncbi:MAG: hypothetical protein HZB71_14790 [Betaproteobacteria bacterium]|nr:hypothetical protein [Betaproteobacteria bacterium]